LALRSLAILAALFVAQRTVGPIRSALLATLGRELDRYLEERLMLALHAPPGIAHLEDPLVLDQIRIAQGVGGSGYTAGAAAVALGNKLPIWLQSGAYAVVLGHFQAWLALGYFAVQVGIAVINRREYLRTVQVAAQQTQTLRRSDYLRDLALTAGAAKEMRLYALADWLIGRYSSSWRESITAVWRDRHQGDARLRAAAIVGALAQVIMLGALGWAGVRGSISLTALTVFVGSVFGMGGLAALGLDDLALARASMRPAPLLLILDEPTAAIDALTEYALFERFREAARRGELQGAITLVVSHRFSTVRMADLIVVLDDGRIRERGSHDELMRNNGLYAELYRLQARAYR
jgi:ABC-type transport system involved in cytochrome bd biosynthesis fused ATPase/permease subunit